MNKIIGYLKNLEGVFFAKDAEGNLREIYPGDPIYSGEIVVDTSGKIIPDAMRATKEDEIDTTGKETDVEADPSKEQDDTAASESTNPKSATSTDTIEESKSGEDLNVNASLREHEWGVDSHLDHTSGAGNPPDPDTAGGDHHHDYGVTMDISPNSVNEAGLPDGSLADNSHMVTGRFTIKAPNGLKDMVIDGGNSSTTITEAQLIDAETTPISIDTGEGTMVIDGHTKASDGAITVEYTYTLNDNQTHTKPDDDTTITDKIAITVTDTDGDSATSTLDITVIDDVPTANPDENSVTEDDAQNTVTGNVFGTTGAAGTDVEDVLGADQTTTPVTAVETAAGVIGTINGTTTGLYGTLTLNDDGTYSYELDNTNSQVDALNVGDTLQEVFSYIITDSDGDKSTTALEISINGSNDAPIISVDTPLERIENNLNGFTGEGAAWEGNVYSIITQSEMLAHLDITDPDSTNFEVTLHGATVEWHGGIESNNSTFTSNSGALVPGTNPYDETVIQVNQAFLNNYPTVNAQVGDFYFDHVDFDKLAIGDTATIEFDVIVTDGQGGQSNETRMTITVDGSNDQPVTVDYTDTYHEDSIVAADVAGTTNILSGASDIDLNDVLSVGKVNGSSANVGQPVVVSFAYTDKDGNSATQDLNVTVNSDGSYTISKTDLDAIPQDVVATGTLKYNVVDDNGIAPATPTDESSFSDEKTVTIEIIGDNDAPVALTDGTTAIGVNTTGVDGAMVFDSRGSNPELLGGADSVQVSMTISGETGSRSLLSYAAPSNNNEFLLFTNPTGTSLGVYINGSNKSLSLGSTIYDGNEHTLNVNWDSSTGNVEVKVDGAVTDTDTLKQGYTLSTDGVLMLGQEQDSTGGSLDPSQIFSGEYSDVSISTNGVEIAHWEMDVISSGLVEDNIGSYDLTVTGDVVVHQHDPLLHTLEDAPLTIDPTTLLANDTDIDGGTLSIAAVTATANTHGVVVLNGDNTVTYTPDANYNGAAEFDYTISDGNGGTDTTSVYLHIDPVNDAPDAVDDSYTENVDAIGVNTTGVDGAMVFDSRGSNPELLGGADSVQVSMTISGETGSRSLISYAAPSNNNEFLLFTNPTGTSLGVYINGSNKSLSLGSTIYDGNEHTLNVNWDSSTGNVEVKVDGAVTDTDTLKQGYTLSTDGVLMLGQEQDSTGGSLDPNQIFSGEYSDVSIVTNGTEVAHWEMNEINTGLVEDSVGNFNLSVSGDVSVVSHANPLITDEDTSLIIQNSTLLANDSDIDGDALGVTAVTATADTHGAVVLNGNGTITYTPDTNYNGTVKFSYTVSDGNGGSDTANVDLLVNSVNDLPTVDSVNILHLQPPKGEMVFWYDFNESTTDDKSGNNHTASEVGTTGIYTTADDTEINTGSYDKKTIAASFTTASVDAADPFQVIYEQGGAWNGYNISIKGDHLYASVWGESYATINPDYAIIDLGTVNANTSYNVVMVHDATSANGGTLTAYLDGVQNTDVKTGVGEMGGHSGDVGIGGYKNDTIDPTNPTANVSGNGGAFQGTIDEILSWNTASVTTEINDYFMGNSVGTAVNIDANETGLVDLFDVDASDVEDGTMLSYVLQNNHNGLFLVDGDGIVSVNADGLYISKSYDLQVDITDSNGGTSVQDVSVTVQGKEVVHLNMNGDLNDSASSGTVQDNATARNGATTDGDHLILDGIDDYVDFARSNDIDSVMHEQRSVAVWFKTGDGTGTQYIFAEGGGTRSLQIYTENGVLMAKGYNKRTVAQGENDWTTETVLNTGIDVADNQWHHAAITLVGDSSDPQHGLAADGFKLYLDGNFEDSGTGGALYGHDNAHIGSDYNGNDTFNGEIDGFRLYNEALPADQINELSSATVIDGIVAGLYYETSDGLSGYTDEHGSFEYRAGENVTFKIGDLRIGTIETDSIEDGKVFLQDIAAVERTDMNNEHVENMAVLLQSLDSDSSENIVITEEMHDAFSNEDFDLATISEEDLVAVIEETGKEAVSEDDAMEHVQDMLEEYTDLEESEFDERTEDDNEEEGALVLNDEDDENIDMSALDEEASEDGEPEGAEESDNDEDDENIDMSALDEEVSEDNDPDAESDESDDLDDILPGENPEPSTDVESSSDAASESQSDVSAPDPTVTVNVEEQIPVEVA